MVRPTPRPRRFGFTLIELLTVIVILAVLVALLIPAVGAAIRKAREAAVSAEINQLANALAQFKSQYGDYPPSRMLLSETGNYPTSNVTAIAPGDITLGQLAQRSVSYLRRFWPRVNISTTGAVSPLSGVGWYDFNGNAGTVTSAEANYIIHGHECLVFFLGGLPVRSATGFGASGFAKDPTNPFRPSAGPAWATTNRAAPLFEFQSPRLYLDPAGTSGIPGYYDSLGATTGPTGNPAASPINFYAYFSAYGNATYDPNDVNFTGEADDSTGASPIGLAFVGIGQTAPTGASAAPNPYTATPTSGTIVWQNPSSFQLISPGLDGLYGVGGQYLATAPGTPLPPDGNTAEGSPFAAVSTGASGISALRIREFDNLTNFKGSRLN